MIKKMKINLFFVVSAQVTQAENVMKGFLAELGYE
jgi:hypothetical protein